MRPLLMAIEFIIEDGDVKTILNERIQLNNGDMNVEDLREVLKAEITMIYNAEIS